MDCSKDMGEKMLVVQYSNYGGGVQDLQNAEVLIPVPGEGEILIRVEAVSLNPVDWKIQRGQYRPSIPAKFPYVPCSDVSGEVVSLGPHVTGFSVGDRVVSYLDHKKGGGLARYAAAEPKFTAKLPIALPYSETAGLPIAGLTALKSLQDSAHINIDGTYKGNILVTAASGGVGTYVVQLAKLAGAHVVATCGSRNLELVKSLGADEVMDYKTSTGGNFQSSTCSKFDVIIHCATGIPWYKFERVLSSRGILVHITPKPVNIFRRVLQAVTFSKKTLVPFYLTPRAEDLRFLVDLVQQGKLKTVVDSTHSLVQTKDAWVKSMGGHAVGKIMIVHNNEF